MRVYFILTTINNITVNMRASAHLFKMRISTHLCSYPGKGLLKHYTSPIFKYLRTSVLVSMKAISIYTPQNSILDNFLSPYPHHCLSTVVVFL